MRKLKSRFYSNLPKIIRAMFLGLLVLLFYNALLNPSSTKETIQTDSGTLNIKNIVYVLPSKNLSNSIITYKKNILFGLYSYYTEIEFDKTFENVRDIIEKSGYADCFYSTSCGGINLMHFINIGEEVKCERPCSYDYCTRVCTSGGCILIPSDELGGIDTACAACPKCN